MVADDEVDERKEAHVTMLQCTHIHMSRGHSEVISPTQFLCFFIAKSQKCRRGKIWWLGIMCDVKRREREMEGFDMHTFP